jgi:hypothetical protein
MDYSCPQYEVVGQFNWIIILDYYNGLLKWIIKMDYYNGLFIIIIILDY